ncbi:uncharacterized protein [Elaeis guineensis]|uniref:uncharacterized protein n=1 Tax=Elaeis guineensis var. tenera TaxID=51953 RepID=UPI003C6D27FA
MASSTQIRLMSDLKAIRNEPPEGCSASPLSDENLFVWSAAPTKLHGKVVCLGCGSPLGTTIRRSPPRVRFTSEVFHPHG